MKTLSVTTLRLPQPLWEKIKRLAAQENLSAQQWAQRALTEAVKKGGK